MLNATTSITFSAGAGANADGVLSAPLWNVVITTPLCVGCNVLSANPFTNPLSEAGIHALTVSGLPSTPAPIIVVPIDPALTIDESALLAAQLAALQRVGNVDANEEASRRLCEDHSGAVTSDSQSIRPTQTGCKLPNQLIMPERNGAGR